MGFGLIASLSGLRTTFAPLREYADHSCMMALYDHMLHDLTDIAGGSVPKVSVFAGRIVAPTRFAATFQYRDRVCRSFLYISTHAQRDRKHMGVTLPEFFESEDGDSPSVTHPTFLAFTTAAKGFGMFAATSIPCSGEILNTTAPRSPECIATYGGMVCCEHEAKQPNYLYLMEGELLRSNKRFSPEKYVPLFPYCFQHAVYGALT